MNKIKDEEQFNSLKKTVQNILETKRGKKKDLAYAPTLPNEVGIKLTNRCNLRCRHCYEWGDNGTHQHMSKVDQHQDIDINIIEKILIETDENLSRLYLWGGEPFCYKKFDQLIDLLKVHKREVIICTNGTLVKEHSEAICEISEGLTLLFAFEGFEEEHDKIRGKHNFSKVLENISHIYELKEKGIFKGTIAVNTVIHNETINYLDELIRFYEDIHVDQVFITYPWYISETTAKEMDTYCKEHINFIETNQESNSSWHCFNYHLNEEKTEELVTTINRIKAQKWTPLVRIMPDLPREQVRGYIKGDAPASFKNKNCLALSSRMDVLPNGDVTACKFFDEMRVGSLKEQNVQDIWHGKEYRHLRCAMGKKLAPVCTKCNLLFLYGGDI